MKPSLTLVLLLGCLITPVPAAMRLQPAEEIVSLSQNRKLAIAVPPGLVLSSDTDERGVVMVRIGHPQNRVSLDLIFLPDPDERFKNARTRKEMMNEQFDEYVGSSAEKAMQFEELEPRVGAGTYCVFTDAKWVGKTDLPPGEYLHVTAGLKAWPGVVAIFRLFSQDTTTAEYVALMKMLRESVHERPVPLR